MESIDRPAEHLQLPKVPLQNTVYYSASGNIPRCLYSDPNETRRKKRRINKKVLANEKEISLDVKCHNLSLSVSDEHVELQSMIESNSIPAQREALLCSVATIHEIDYSHTTEGGNIHEEDIDVLDEELTDNFGLISDSDTEDTDSMEDDSIEDFLRQWYFESKIPKISKNHFDSLLKGLRKWHPELPKTSVTLLHSPRSLSIEDMENGKFHHFGLRDGIVKRLRDVTMSEDIAILNLNFNVDGLPLFKSSRKQFWPILCNIYEIPLKTPFIVSLFYGTAKPPIEEFLKPVTKELEDLITNGLVINNKKYTVKVRAILCDAPARAYIKCIKGHNGFYGCDRCIQHGERLNHRTLFPQPDAELRTDESFEAMDDEEHHLTVTPLIELGIGMISSFPHDPMHLVYLGVMRRLLYIWKGKGATHMGKLQLKDRIRLDNKLLEAQRYWPSDFVRQPRTIQELDFWKATELRQFLLYLGPVFLKDIFSEEQYSHFMLLFTAILILDSACHTSLCCYAKTLLTKFVNDSPNLYGKEFLIYNVHSLVHLADDVARLGPLHTFSAFPFEDFLGSLKSMLKKPNQALQQVVKRLKEREVCGILPAHDSTFQTDLKFKTLREIPLAHNGILPTAGVKGAQYAAIENTLFKLSTKLRDSIVILDNKNVFKIFNFVKSGDAIYAIGKVFTQKKSFHAYPADLERFSIFQVHQLSSSYSAIVTSRIRMKAMLLPYKNGYACLPIHHSSNKYPFCVVEFIEEAKAIAVIPTAWVVFSNKEEVYCHWPNESTKKHTLLRSAPEEDWAFYRVKIAHFSRNYKSAQRALKTYEELTDIEKYSDEEASSMPLQTSVRQLQPVSSFILPLSPVRRNNEVQKKNSCTCAENQALLGRVLKAVESNTEEIKNLQLSLIAIARKLDLTREEVVKMDNLPLESPEGLTKLEESLQDSGEFSKLVHYLGRSGGRDVNEVTRRILFLVFTNSTAREVNWVGGHGKLGVKAFPHVVQLICAAVRQTPTTKLAKQAEVEDVIKRWLRTALDRDGGRTKRKPQPV